MKAKIFNFSSFLILLTLLVFSACKKQFDEPPISELPNLERNATIAEVIALANTTPVALTTQVLEATVIADDASGNFYKQLVIQDSTGGIRIDIDAYSIYTDFPIGRKVWIKCDGLYIWQDGDVPALIGSSNTNDSRIPQSTYKQFILGGEYDQPLSPKLKTIFTISPADYNTLIQLDDVELDVCFAGSNYAFPSTQMSKNADVHDCQSGLTGFIILRNSGFASFAGELMPSGKGSMVGVLNSFSGTLQMLIRDPSDLESMTEQRCVAMPSINSISIAALRAQYSGSPVNAVANKISGIVISDSESSQWQGENIVIQEPNGSGITIRFDDKHNFSLNDYLEVSIYNGVLDEYNDLLQISGLSSSCAKILPNTTGISITPRIATITDIINNQNSWESTLIKVENAFINGGFTYGDMNVLLNDPTGNIDLHTYFGASFGPALIPSGTGEVTAVISDYTFGPQLLIRNLSDVNISGSGGGSTGNLNQISIQDARDLFTGTSTTGTDTTKIVGIVISDLGGGNWQPTNMVIQESGGSGIVVRFTGNHSFNLGDEVEVNISNQTIEEFNGLLQVNSVPNSNASLISTGNSISPRVATVADINTNANAWESTLIQVMSANLNGGTTYGDFGIMLNDASGSISMFSAFSNFTSTAIPTGTGDVTGVVGDYNGVQINIRNTSDVNISGGGGGGCSPTTTLAEDFSSVSNNSDISFNCWTNYIEAGSRKWQGKIYNSADYYAQATAYNSGEASNIYWLISSEIDCDVNKFLSFETAKAFWVHDGLEVFVSSNYDGSNVGIATWTQITTATIATNTDADNAWIPSGNVDLSTYTGQTIHIAYKYTGSDTGGQTSTYRVDNVTVVDQ